MDVDRINVLPENILLEIFTYLPMKERCSIARVCVKWRRISLDNRLWRHVDFTPYRIELRHMWKVMRTKFSPCLRALRLKGYLEADSTTRRWNKDSLTDAMLVDLRERCPNLSVFQATYSNLTSWSIKSLPQNLVELSLTNSHIPTDWFDPLQSSDDVLSGLIRLDLSQSAKTTNQNVEIIATKLRQLRVLKLAGCYRVTVTGLKFVAENLSELRELDLSGTGCCDLSIHHISRGLVLLEVLNLSGCTRIKVGSIDTLRMLKCLQVLRLRGCSKIVGVGVDTFKSCKNLRMLDVRETEITVDDSQSYHFTIKVDE